MKMPVKTLRRPEISEYAVPLIFLGIAYKFAFFEIFANVPAYRRAGIFSERVWAVIFLTAGLLLFASTISRVYRLRIIFLSWAALIWWYWAIAIILAFSPGFGDVIWTSLAILTSWTLMRLKNFPPQ